MIKLILGNVGSGKTASMVRWMRDNKHLNIITNIEVRGKDFNHVIKLKPEMILLKEEKGNKRSGEIIYDIKLNVDFWKNLVKEKGRLTVIIDEAHSFFNPRRSMSKVNLIMGDFLALLRRVLGDGGGNQGELILITQLLRRIDVIAREMCTEAQFYVHHYHVLCKKCKYVWQENNEMSIKHTRCPLCLNHHIEKFNNIIEVWHFKNVELYDHWKTRGIRTYYSHYIIRDIRSVFNHYNTVQWDDLLSNY